MQTLEKPSTYGLHYATCPCGWITLGKVRGDQPVKCEACGGVPNKVEFTADVACMICTVADLRGEMVRKHAEQHGLLVYQQSKNRYVVLRKGSTHSVNYKDGRSHGYVALEVAHGPSFWQNAMKYIRDNTPPLPDYLKT